MRLLAIPAILVVISLGSCAELPVFDDTGVVNEPLASQNDLQSNSRSPKFVNHNFHLLKRIYPRQNAPITGLQGKFFLTAFQNAIATANTNAAIQSASRSASTAITSYLYTIQDSEVQEAAMKSLNTCFESNLEAIAAMTCEASAPTSADVASASADTDAGAAVAVAVDETAADPAADSDSAAAAEEPVVAKDYTFVYKEDCAQAQSACSENGKIVASIKTEEERVALNTVGIPIFAGATADTSVADVITFTFIGDATIVTTDSDDRWSDAGSAISTTGECLYWTDAGLSNAILSQEPIEPVLVVCESAA